MPESLVVFRVFRHAVWLEIFSHRVLSRAERMVRGGVVLVPRFDYPPQELLLVRVRFPLREIGTVCFTVFTVYFML